MDAMEPFDTLEVDTCPELVALLCKLLDVPHLDVKTRTDAKDV